MNKNIKIIGLVILVVIVGYFIYTYVIKGRPNLVPTEKGLVSKVPVKVLTVKRTNISTEVLLTGNVEADSKITIFSKVQGRLEKLLVEVENAVEKGKQIAIIDHASLEAQVKQAQAQLKSIEVNLNNLAKEKERLDKLYKEGSVSQQAWEKVETAYLAAQSQKELAQATLEISELQLAEAFIKSPISGIVSKKYVGEGDMVSPGTRIIDIVNIDQVKITIGLPEIYLNKVKSETEVEIQVDAYPDKLFTGKVWKVHPELDPQSRTAETEIIIPNPEHILKPGMFSRVKLTIEVHLNIVAVPRELLTREGDKYFVYIADNDYARKREVSLGAQAQGLVEITRNLESGEKIITTTGPHLSDGCEIIMTEEP